MDDFFSSNPRSPVQLVARMGSHCGWGISRAVDLRHIAFEVVSQTSDLQFRTQRDRSHCCSGWGQTGYTRLIAAMGMFQAHGGLYDMAVLWDTGTPFEQSPTSSRGRF